MKVFICGLSENNDPLKFASFVQCKNKLPNELSLSTSSAAAEGVSVENCFTPLTLGIAPSREINVSLKYDTNEIMSFADDEGGASIALTAFVVVM